MSYDTSVKTKKTKMPHTGMKLIKCDVSTKTPSEICKASITISTSNAKTSTLLIKPYDKFNEDNGLMAVAAYILQMYLNCLKYTIPTS